MADKDFDLKDYIQSNSQDSEKSFNPDDYITQNQQHLDTANLPQEQYSPLESFGRGTMQGATLGLGDEIAGGLKAGTAKVGEELGLKEDSKMSLKDLYKMYRDAQRAKNKQAEEQNPKSYLAGNVTGGIGSAVAVPEALMGKGAASAIGAGAVTGLGTSEADLTEPSKESILQAGKDTAMGGAIGAVAHGFINRTGNAINPENLDAAASKLISKSVGIKPTKELATEYNKETGQVSKGSDIIKGTGKTALEQDATPLMGGPEATYDSSLEALDKNRQQLQPLLQSTQEKLDSNLVNTLQEVGPIESKTNPFIDKYLEDIPYNSQTPNLNKTLRGVYDNYVQKLSQADGNLLALNQIKAELQKSAKDMSQNAYVSGSNISYEADMLKKLGGITRQHIEDLANATDQGAGDQIHQINSNIQNMSTYSEAAKKMLDKPQPLIGMKDAAAATIGGLIKGVPGALATSAGKIAIEKSTGNSLGRLGTIASGKVLNAMSKGLKTPAGQIYQKIAPVSTLVSKVVQSPFVQETAQNKLTQNSQDKSTNIARNLYTATDDSLKDVAGSLKKTPGLEFYGDHLNKAIDQNDSGEKDRAIFLILQNPRSRKLVTPSEE